MEEIEKKAIELIKKGHRVDAVKFIRDNTELNLREAKEYMERLIDKIIEENL